MILIRTDHPYLRVGRHTGYLYHRFLYTVCGFYQGRIALRWTYYDAYACIPGQVTISDSNGTGPCTRVYAIKCAWAPVVIPYPIS
jgi:hypothetical protein